MDAMEKTKRTVKTIIGFRPQELAPLIQRWLDENPNVDVTVLIRRSLRKNPELRRLAGKRYAHLVEAA